ncbi:MAG: restriction endonuclease subunit S [Verrucomicrobia bacterium]|nr:restriction endonuclease subunit S [Verrucomicrobiota bacterium]
MKNSAHWHFVSLEEVAEIQTGLSKSASRQGEFVAMPYLRVANVQDGHFDLTEIKEIDVPKDSVERFRVRPGDVLLTEGGDFDKLGRGSVWRGEIEHCVHQNHIFVVRPNPKKLDERFLAYQTQGPRGRAYFQSCSKQSTNLASINSSQLRQFPTALPPLPEQRKIADILSTWDEALEKLDSLITAKDRRKQALMQQLLTGKTRVKGFDSSRGKTKSDRFGVYPGDWRKVALADIIEEVSARNADSQNLPVLSCTKHRGLVLSEEYFGKRVHAEDTSGYRVVRRGEFAYATNHIEEGSIGYQNLVDAGLVSPIYTVFKTKGDIDDNYVFRVFKSPLLIHFYQINTSASVDRRGSLRYDEFSRIRIWLPSKPEQLAINAILDTADQELTLLRTQRNALDQQKRGLMQRLLTGKVRV